MTRSFRTTSAAAGRQAINAHLDTEASKSTTIKSIIETKEAMRALATQIASPTTGGRALAGAILNYSTLRDSVAKMEKALELL
jgi:hypothetical protein